MRKLEVILTVAVLSVLLAAPANAQDQQQEAGKTLYKLQVGPYSVGIAELITLHDGKRDKDLQLRVSYPKEAGEYPVIIWSHGATGTKDMYQPIVKHWVSYGYVCIQANHSDSRAFGEKGKVEVLKDWASRPKDIAFILDSLDEIEKQVKALKGKMDKKIIGVGGHSFGAHTAQLVGGVMTIDPFSKERVSHADKRPKAFLLLSPQGTGEMLDKDSWKNLTRPAIIITGSKDPGRKGEPYTWRLEPFKYSPAGGKYLLFIEGAQHGFGGVVGTDSYTNAGPDNPDHMNYVKSATTAFWDTYLKKDKEAKAFLNGDALEKKSKGKAKIEVKDKPDKESDYKPGPGKLIEESEDADWYDKKRERNVPVRIYAPALKHGNGPFPVVVFSHGGGESREAFTYLGKYWAQHGYIVVFITHEGHDRKTIQEMLKEGKDWRQAMGGMGGPENFPERPADVSFVIDKLLSDKLESRLLKGRINPDLICAAGQCAGSTTALAIVGLTAKMPDNPKMPFRDRRAKIAIALSPQVAGRKTKFGLREDSWDNIVTPALVMTGTKDFTWMPAVKSNPSMRRKAFDSMPQGDKYLVDIKDAEHHAFTDSKPYYPAGRRDPRHHGWIQQATTAYLDAYLKSDDSALAWLRNKELEAATDSECKQEYKPYDFTPIDKYIGKSLSRIGGGCSLILVRGNRVIYRKAYGNFTPDKVVPIASASKWISGGVIMALVDKGKISLDDKASKYLSNFTGKKGEITIRQMFSHTHGFYGKPSYIHDTSLTMEEAVNKIAQKELKFDPGTALYYSGQGMQIAGRICELVEKNPWIKIFRERIAAPLEMENTDYYAAGMTKNPNVAGSVRTCIDDYGNFVTMVLNQGLYKGKRILSEEAVDAMLKNQSGDVKVLHHPYEPHSDVDPSLGKVPYGIGCWLEEYDKKTGEAWEISSGGAFGCMPFVDLKRNLAGVYLPHGRIMKRDQEGTPYNDAARVYFELKPIIAAVMDGKATGKDKIAGEPEKEKTGEESDADARQRAERAVRFLDKDGDGELSRKEMPPRLTRAFDRIDTDGNKKVSTDEFAKFLGRFSRQQGRRQPEKKEQPQEKSDNQKEQKGLYESDSDRHEVGSVKLVTLRDTKRRKELQVRITYPKGEGKFPVIVFSQCVGGSRNDYQPLVKHWAQNGYVVILADHSDSPEVVGGGPRLDWQNRALDMSFVMDSLAELEKKAPELKGKMDGKRIGAGGHLIGSYASCVLAGQRNFNPGAPKNLKDERVKAALLLSPQGRGQGLTEKSWEKIDIPMMVLSGSKIPSRRTSNPAEWRKEPFTFSSPGDKYLVWIEDLDGKYAGLVKGKNAEEEMAAWVKDATLAFWDAYLREKEEARNYLNSDSLQKASGGKVTITAKQNTPSVPLEKLKKNAEKATDYSAKHKGLAVLIMLDGEIVFERYDNGHSKEKPNHLHSATKAFWGVAAAAMVEEGMLSSFDELASKTITEWKNDRLKSNITVRHLMTLSAGLAQDIPALQGFDGTAKDKYTYSVGLRVVSAPGKRFQYGPSCYYVLGEILKRKLKDKKENPLDYLKRRIFKPLGLEVADWKHDPSGNPHMPNGAYLTAREWVKYGQFIIQDGKWEGKQIVEERLLKECFKPSKANKGHGLTFWLNLPGGNGPSHLPLSSKTEDKGGFIYNDGFPDIIGALGAGKNRMYVIPSLKMVVVRQAEGDKLGYKDTDFLRLLLEGITNRH